MEPLAQALQAAMPGLRLISQPLPRDGDLDEALAELDRTLPVGAWLLGWSLGGMLAVALAARPGSACPGVITLASNACFLARDGWPAAMEAATFDVFSSRCATDPAGTLKRFGLLCAQGSSQARALAKRLAPASLEYADPAGLALLASLDNRAALAALKAPQLHLFASADALVPASAASALAQAVPLARVQVLEGSHALPLEAPGLIAAHATAFIKESSHD
jgi:pimeloyl-[acyl-carrier protein] methyl ester esterase